MSGFKWDPDVAEVEYMERRALEEDRDEWKARAEKAERERDELRTRLASLEETVTAAEFWSGR